MAARKGAPKFKAYKKSAAGPPSNPGKRYSADLRGKRSGGGSGSGRQRRDKNGRFK